MKVLSVDAIRRNSATLNELDARIRATESRRGMEWHALCEEFHRRYDDLSFPGGDEMLAKVRNNDPDALEAAVRFLIADPYHFRSGYLKSDLWRWLSSCQLSRAAKRRLEGAALAYLNRRISREFWDMCKVMPILAGPDFWLAVSRVLQTGSDAERTRAFYLLIHGTNVHSGAMLRRDAHRYWQA